MVSSWNYDRNVVSLKSVTSGGCLPQKNLRRSTLEEVLLSYCLLAYLIKCFFSFKGKNEKIDMIKLCQKKKNRTFPKISINEMKCPYLTWILKLNIFEMLSILMSDIGSIVFIVNIKSLKWVFYHSA